jgi:CRP-like cAMP-binding protein
MVISILKNIQSIISLNEAEEAAFVKILDVKQFKKKEFLLQEGRVCNKIFFVNSGCARLFYNVDGVENTVQFFFPNSWYTDFSSFLTGQAALENLQALEPCEVVIIKKEDLYKLYNWACFGGKCLLVANKIE